MKKVFCLLLLTMFVSGVSYAESPWLKEEGYAAKTIGKLDYGLMNFLFGWADLGNEPAKSFENSESLFKGAAKGVVDMIINTAGGAVNIVTFLFPFDVPLPDDGVDIH